MAEFGTLDFAVSFSPTTAFPLDSRYYFESLEDANSAASKAVQAGSSDGKYFFGENVVVVADGKATMYIIQPDRTLSKVGEGSGGTLDYTALTNKPSIEGVELNGDMTFDDLGIKQKYTASDITFSDGYTFQQKYDAGELTGESGVFYGSEEPANPDIKVWIDPNGSSTPSIPNPTISDAKKSVVVNATGDGFDFETPMSGGELLLAEYTHQGNQEIHFTSFDWEAGIGECTEPHGLTKNASIMIVPNNWWNSDFRSIHKAIPYEWITYKGLLYAYAVDETHIMVSSNNTTGVPVTVDPGGQYNSYLDCTQFHFEVGASFKIENFPVKPTELRVTIAGFIAGASYRYIQTWVEYNNGKHNIGVYNHLLSAERFGTVTNPYHAIYQLFNMEVSLVGGAYIQYLMQYALLGRRRDDDFYVETEAFTRIHNHYDTEFSKKNIGDNSGHSHFYTVVCSPVSPVYANHSVIKVYAKAVKQE